MLVPRPTTGACRRCRRKGISHTVSAQNGSDISQPSPFRSSIRLSCRKRLFYSYDVVRVWRWTAHTNLMSLFAVTKAQSSDRICWWDYRARQDIMRNYVDGCLKMRHWYIIACRPRISRFLLWVLSPELLRMEKIISRARKAAGGESYALSIRGKFD